ncbi:hypothetical protein BJ138DRAFT_1021357, partial [Hygrophoropsis aurantiaca]
KFRAIHQRVVKLQAYTYSHLPLDRFLLRMHGLVSLIPDGHTRDISGTSFNIYTGLRNAFYTACCCEIIGWSSEEGCRKRHSF